MQFNSYIFILLFLPLAVIGYFLLARLHYKAAQIFLLSMSLWFYGYFNVGYLAIMCSSILFNFLFSKYLGRERAFGKKLVLAAAVLFNLGLIFYFKYYDFFIGSINTAFHTDFVLKHILLPLGISFFTFQQLSYVVDSYSGQTRGYGFVEYALFVSFFPQLVAGPIVLHNELVPQFRDSGKRRMNADNLVRGISLFILGLAKKVLIADTFGKAVSWGYANVDAATSLDLVIATFAYTFQIYFDFSGYSDMATGIASMFNFTLPMNFNSPYKALDINDFWRRWHMTLTRFLRTYIYFPLGGSRKGEGRTYFNIMVVFLASGIWHGANWTFILWGLLHGAACVADRIIHKAYEKIPAVFRWLVTFLLVDLLWILFRADSIEQCGQIIGKIFSFTGRGISEGMYEAVALPEVTWLLSLNTPARLSAGKPWLFIAVLFLIGLAICLCFRNNYERKTSASVFSMAGIALLFVWCLISLGSVSVFLYFNF
ncbi:MAG: MBOAT family O-acyltransferase [Lachnospiraceae bacterium]|nr:MBOAT family O-acyltransferase [Lachnospiraceae bacterium]